MKPQAKAKKTQSYVDQNPVEILKGLGSGVASSIADESKKGIGDLWEQLLGSSDDKRKTSGDLSEGQELHLLRKTKKETYREPVEPGIDYRKEIIDVTKRGNRENTQVLDAKITEILAELKKITAASAEIAVEFKEVAVEQRIENPGEYHVTFFQWMLSMVRAAREKIEDSGAWLSVMKSKKKQKDYWAMFKKHGTTFGLSNERVIATQAG